MTAPSSRAPTHLQPRPKGATTAITSSQSVTPPTKLPPTRPDVPLGRLSSQQHGAQLTSNQATISLVRRTLCSQLADKSASISDLLPPLTSSNDVDLELYAYIAIVIKEFVYTWYGKLTPDQVFVEEVVKIIAHCTRGLEQRLRKVDLEVLIFDELPELLDAHVRAYRISHSPLHPSPLEADTRLIYHSLWQSPALSPVPIRGDHASISAQKENEAVYRELLIQGALALLLPTEDFENGCLTSLVGQILSEMILGNGLGGKASEPWLIWEGIIKIIEVIQNQLPTAKAQVRVDRSHSDVSATEKSPLEAPVKLRPLRWSPQKTFWLVLQYVFLTFTTIRFVVITIATSSSLPSRLPPYVKISGKSATFASDVQPPYSDSSTPSGPRISSFKQPVLKMKIWPCVSHLLDLDIRMPWISATISMLQWCALHGPGAVGCTDGTIDKLLSHAIHKRVLNPALLPNLLRTARSALFPNNAPASPRTVPSVEEGLLIRRQCAERVLELIPDKMQEVYFGTGAERRRVEVEELLNVFEDPYCNKHLLYGVVELIIVRLMPELTERPISQLLEERLN